MDENAIARFFDNWNIYQKVLANNYMFHEEIQEQVSGYLQKRYSLTPLKILDLGSGDAHTISKAMDGMNIAYYCGYDLSKNALEYAKENLEKICKSFSVKQDDLGNAVKKEKQLYNVIYSSYAIHHLSDEQKIELMANAFNLLEDNGDMIVIDTFLKNDSSRWDYISDYNKWIDDEWIMLSEKEKNMIAEHITNYDFPANYDWFKKAALGKGFKVLEIPVLDHRHKMLVLQKNV